MTDKYFLFNTDKDFLKGKSRDMQWSEGSLTVPQNARTGYFISPPLDSGNKATVWKRAVIRTQRLENSKVSIIFCAAESRTEAENIIELLYRFPDSGIINAVTFHQPSDVLLTGLQGRYLFFMLTINNSGKGNCAVQSVQIFEAQESFTQYLPELFQDDNSFLDRFLRIFASQYLSVEQTIGRLSTHFNPLTASPETLRWLAEMQHIPYIELWETEKLRLVLSEYVYGKKGTLSGLIRLLTIFTGSRPLVAECFRMITGDSEADNAYANSQLAVFVPEEAELYPEQLTALHLIIQSYLPVNIEYKLTVLYQQLSLCGSTYLGINSRLSGYTSASVNDALRFVRLG